MVALPLLAALLCAPLHRAEIVARHPLAGGPTMVWPIGNGEFCVGVDGSGAQNFAGNTMAHWGWHSFPLPDGLRAADLPPQGTYAEGRPTGGDDWPAGRDAERAWLFDNPHRLPLGRLRLVRADGQPVKLEALTNAKRHLDMWRGWHTASYTLDGEPVAVTTAVHGELDAVGLRVISPLVGRGELRIELDCPYPTLDTGAQTGDFGRAGDHRTRWWSPGPGRGQMQRFVDTARYNIELGWTPSAIVHQHAHRVTVTGRGDNTLELVAWFGPGRGPAKLPSAEALITSSAARWEQYWRSGGAIDLSGSRDPRWRELERRIVQSQYQLGCQSAGSWPPAETGLLGLDPWRGQFHGEMIWWHLAHYALWDRWPLAERGLEAYQRFVPSARALAQQLGLKGLVWPKSVGPEGRSAPWFGNQVLIWKQPHPIFFAELAWRDEPTRATMDRWWPIVEGTAEAMADYPQADAAGVYHLRPAMPPSEQGITYDTVFDLAYWRYGLDLAQQWRQRRGLEPEPHWQAVRDGLAPLPQLDGYYIHSPEWTNTYTERNWEHPDPVGVLGMLPLVDGVDPVVARRTVERISAEWQWDRCWGWDFPWTAMAAARVGRPDLAVESLLRESPRNAYDERGINVGGPCPYLPGNGGLLYAVAMMCAGWDGGPGGTSPGFPPAPEWVVRWEGLRPAP